MAHILVVDDEHSMLKVLSGLLAVAGHQTTTVDRGDTAIAKLREASFDLTVSDMRMNPVDGMAVLTAARRLTPNMPVIMLSAHNCAATKQAAKDLGAYAYLTKPFGASELLDTVDRALGEFQAGDKPNE